MTQKSWNEPFTITIPLWLWLIISIAIVVNGILTVIGWII